MKSRAWVILLLLFIILVALVASQFEKSERDLRARVTGIEAQLASLKLEAAKSINPAELDQLRSENTRLAKENDMLRRSLNDQKEQLARKNRERVQMASDQEKASDQPPYDPLAFYRRNPELMKRYFPQLYAAELKAGTAANGANSAATPELQAPRSMPVMDPRSLYQRYFPQSNPPEATESKPKDQQEIPGPPKD